MYTGTEYKALFVSTTEPVTNDTEGCPTISDPTKSLSNPYVFNTAISRACTLVIAFGNPFLLLKIEKYMEKEYGNHKTKCWSYYLKHCLEKGTVTFNACLDVSDEQKGVCLDQIRRNVEERLGTKIEMDCELLKVITCAALPINSTSL